MVLYSLHSSVFVSISFVSVFGRLSVKYVNIVLYHDISCRASLRLFSSDRRQRAGTTGCLALDAVYWPSAVKYIVTVNLRQSGIMM